MPTSYSITELRNHLKASQLFRGLSPELAESLTQGFHSRIVKPNSLILFEDQSGGVISFLAQGTAKVSRSRPNGSTLLNVIGPGEIIGEVSLLDGGGHTADIVTLEEVTLLWIERQVLQEILDSHPIMYKNLAVLVAQRLRLASSRLEALASLDVPGRVAFQLLAFSRVYGQPTPEGVLLPLLLTQGDIAELIGATRTRVNQTLASMRKMNLVSIDNNNYITLLDMEGLEKRFVIF